MPFEINRETPKPRLLRMGHAPRVIEPEPLLPTLVEGAKTIEPPPVKETKHRGRPKKMADKKLDQESGGPEVIRQDDAGEKGAIGSHGENVPAQDKGGSEADKGNQEGK